MQVQLDIPANVERDVERYAQAERISPAEAAVRLIQSGLKATRRKTAPAGGLSEGEWQRLREIPGFAFLEGLPDGVTDGIEAASRRTRAERFSPRG